MAGPDPVTPSLLTQGCLAVLGSRLPGLNVAHWGP